jgi:hypothetical protein
MTELMMRHKSNWLSTNSDWPARGTAKSRPSRSRQPPRDADSRAHTAEALLGVNGTASILLDVAGRVVYMNRPARQSVLVSASQPRRRRGSLRGFPSVEASRRQQWLFHLAESEP